MTVPAALRNDSGPATDGAAPGGRPARSAPPLQPARCPVCQGSHAHYSFSSHGVRVLQCARCNFTFRAGAPAPATDGAAAAAALARRFGGLG
ncbi:MAG TPA: hypothetical protein VEB66_09065, partial [Opitutaceae bacterium]|nr:hypothetical protein [Opitutaceae bacterium]